ncbi:MAG: hypothetical protein ABSD20_10550 [Terriglobales bacterium]
MHRLSSSFILGYHGCDEAVGERLLNGASFVPSDNDYDWLGSGIYFWEANPLRALDWARELQQPRSGTTESIQNPFVVGAVIELGYCLDLISSNGTSAVRAAYSDFRKRLDASGKALPKNFGGIDLLLRRLDCAVINHLHNVRRETGQPGFDTVRGVFIEGKPIYENSGFREKTHIQICVRNPEVIKGVFRVPQ